MTTEQQNIAINDGGPAFPTDTIITLARASGRELENFPCSQGMSLRDWFAGMALIGILASDTQQSVRAATAATQSYEQADAMLKARGK